MSLKTLNFYQLFNFAMSRWIEIIGQKMEKKINQFINVIDKVIFNLLKLLNGIGWVGTHPRHSNPNKSRQNLDLRKKISTWKMLLGFLALLSFAWFGIWPWVFLRVHIAAFIHY